METRSDIEAQALDWLIRMDGGGLSAGERAQFDVWIAASESHHVAFLRAEAAWKRADRLRKLRPLDGEIDENLLDPSQGAVANRGARPRFPVWKSLSAAACLATVGVVVWFVVQSQGWQTYDTAVGSTERVVLQDGSTLSLNTDTRVQVRFTEERRRIVLKRGEALFEVAHDASRPFDVQAGESLVRAVGTAFKVRMHGKTDVEVLVTDGTVAVAPVVAAISIHEPLPPTLPKLTVGESARVKRDGLDVQKVSHEEIAHKLAWRDGRLWFDRDRLSDAVAEFNRYNRRRLVVADPSIADLRIGGGFAATDPESFVAALERSFGVRAVLNSQANGEGEIALYRAE